MQDEHLTEYCKWRSARGLWFPALIMLGIILTLYIRIQYSAASIITNSVFIIATLGLSAGLMETILSNGKNLWLKNFSAAILVTIGISEIGILVVLVIFIIIALPIYLIAETIIMFLCKKHSHATTQGTADSGI